MLKGGKNMNCKETQELISAYIDHECSVQEQMLFEKHILTCEECKVEYEMIQSLVNQLGKVEEVEIPENFHQDLMNKLEMMMPSQKSIWKKINYRSSVIAAALLILVTLAIFGTSTLFDFSMKKSATMDAPMELKMDSKVATDSTAPEASESEKVASEVAEESSLADGKSFEVSDSSIAESEDSELSDMITNEQSLEANEQPLEVQDETTVTNEVSTGTKEESTGTNEDSTESNEQLSIASEQPAVAGEQPTTESQVPTAEIEQPKDSSVQVEFSEAADGDIQVTYQPSNDLDPSYKLVLDEQEKMKSGTIIEDESEYGASEVKKRESVKKIILNPIVIGILFVSLAIILLRIFGIKKKKE